MYNNTSFDYDIIIGLLTKLSSQLLRITKVEKVSKQLYFYILYFYIFV